MKRTWSDPIWLIKSGIWMYFYLLIFEGALRKWVVPGLATPLLIIRDPVALFILLTAYKYRLYPNVFYIKIVNVIGVISVITAMGVGHGNLFVALYGARTLFIHFPMMFVMGKIFTQLDVEKMGRAILWIAIPMAILIGLQFYSPQTAWVNRGVGGNMEGGGFSGSGEFFRPPGTFSFTTGLVQYFSIVSIFVLYFFIRSERINKFLLIGSALALVIAIPLSISRSLLFNTIIELMMMVMAVSTKSKHVSKIFTLFGVGFLALAILSQTEFFQVSTGAFTDRFDTANEAEGGLDNVFVDRFLGGMLKALSESTEMSFFGMGIGMGSNVGAQLLFGKANVFLISEEEWGRIIGELGPIMGLILIFIRIHFASVMAWRSFQFMRKDNFLPWMMLGVSFLIFLQGQWAQPTSVGFSTLMGGMMLAGFNESEDT
ncbi:MAG: hypothetical protein IT245_01130 [Bacteroidia bacterium]|nr:hypothetical protein [Bacteroidia bacterium]